MTQHDDGRSQQELLQGWVDSFLGKNPGHTWLRASNFLEQLFLQNPHIPAKLLSDILFHLQGEDRLGSAACLPRWFGAQELPTGRGPSDVLSQDSSREATRVVLSRVS